MLINEMFKGMQGEGVTAGTPAFFVRLAGCNLECDFCDTKYHKNGKEMHVNDVANAIKESKLINVVITGGEPMLQIDELYDLMYDIPERLIYNKFHLETNGTIYSDKVKEFTSISCSPKQQDIKHKTSKELNSYKKFNKLKYTSFKFVYENKDNQWWVNFKNKVGIQDNKTFIMPEGATRKEQLKKMPEVMEYCLNNNYMFSPRLHVLGYNNRRGV
ncbi:7-carboxy-7-deazaguanine synthase QueE [Candidatus Pacearchaeota archaeon]|nr:7-carboxy-7-deazaguanine synthase QueE [Candidatus Pacearchaeota archaeon]